MKAYGFIHCHSDYSLKDSTNKIEKLCLAAKEMGAKAITLTDHGVCAGHVEFLNACNAIGIKGIPGVEAYVQTDYADHAHLILLPMNYEGYQELCKAVTLSNQHMLTLGRIPSPVMNYEILESCFASGNVIASSACVNGVLSCILLHNKHILHEIDLLKRRQKKYPAPNTLEMKLLLFEIEKTSIEVEALISQKYIDRMEYELNTIIDMGYADYILIVADYVQEGKRIAKMNNPYKMGYGVGPGRGSGAGSLVNYCMGITALDPLQYNLLFERFLNKERVSMPDIDVDFSNEIRDNLIQYVMKKYGSSAVAYIRTVMTQLAKACIQNMARVRGYEMYPMPEKEQGKKSKEICEQGRKEIRRIGEELCKNISNKTGTLSENRDDILKDYETSKEHRIILDRAVSIEGIITAFSVHPAGIIIGDGKPLSSYIPMYYNTQKEQWAVSCNMVEAEEIGLLKMDFLALKNLDIISESIRRIKKNYGIEIDPEKLPFEDEVFSHIFAEGRTSFIFQFESDGMKKNAA